MQQGWSQGFFLEQYVLADFVLLLHQAWVWKQMPVHHLSTLSTPLPCTHTPTPTASHTRYISWLLQIMASEVSEGMRAFLAWCTLPLTLCLLLHAYSSNKLACWPRFFLFWSGIWAIWRWHTANACFMIVHVSSNGHEYGLILSTFHKYIYYIVVYTKVDTIYQISIPHCLF